MILVELQFFEIYTAWDAGYGHQHDVTSLLNGFQTRPSLATMASWKGKLVHLKTYLYVLLTAGIHMFMDGFQNSLIGNASCSFP